MRKPTLLPLAAASTRLRRPGGRPRKRPAPEAIPDLTCWRVGDPSPTPSPPAQRAEALPATPVDAGDPEATNPKRASVAPLSPRLLGVEDASAYLGVSSWSLRAWISAGVVPVVRIPLPVTVKRKGGECRRVLLDVHDLDCLIEKWKVRT